LASKVCNVRNQYFTFFLPDTITNELVASSSSSSLRLFLSVLLLIRTKLKSNKSTSYSTLTTEVYPILYNIHSTYSSLLISDFWQIWLTMYVQSIENNLRTTYANPVGFCDMSEWCYGTPSSLHACAQMYIRFDFLEQQMWIHTLIQSSIRYVRKNILTLLWLERNQDTPTLYES
jgi:hypothetical protein